MVVLVGLIFGAMLSVSCNKANKPPEVPAVPTGPSSGKTDTLYSFSSSASDPDGDSVAVRFAWGDGDTSEWSLWVAEGDSISMSHSWSDSGTFSVKAQAKDESEAASSWSGGHQLTIGNLPNRPPYAPEIPTGPASGFISLSYPFISTAADPDGDSIAIRFDWGDGDTSAWSSYIVYGETVMVSHSWTDSGTYQVKAQAKDEDDAVSGWSVEHPVEISAGWTKTFGGPATDAGHSVRQTADGGYIVAGYTGSYGAGSHDYYLVKTDSLGYQQWDTTYGSELADYARQVQQTADGGYIIVGSATYSSRNDELVYIVKTDKNGAEEWHQVKGYTDRDNEGWSIQQTADGGYIVVGKTADQGSAAIFFIKINSSGYNEWFYLKGYDDYDDYGYSVRQTADYGYIIVGTTSRYGNGDIFLIKTGSDGATAWSQHIGGSAGDYGYSVQQTSDGGYIIAGTTFSYGSGAGDIYLVKTDAGGNQTWAKTFGGSSYEFGQSVQQTSDGGYIVVGSTASYGAGGSDVYLIKTDAGGNQEWYKTIGGSSDDSGGSVQQTADGGYIVTGYTKSSGAGDADVYLIKTDAEGNTLKTFPLGPARGHAGR
jgi:hypothetical protein